MCWLIFLLLVWINLFTYTKVSKYKTVLGKLAGRMGTLRGPDFGDHCSIP